MEDLRTAVVVAAKRLCKPREQVCELIFLTEDALLDWVETKKTSKQHRIISTIRTLKRELHPGMFFVIISYYDGGDKRMYTSGFCSLNSVTVHSRQYASVL
jgi:hypothetical protein